MIATNTQSNTTPPTISLNGRHPLTGLGESHRELARQRDFASVLAALVRRRGTVERNEIDRMSAEESATIGMIKPGENDAHAT